MLDHSIPTMVVTIQLLHCNKTNLKIQYGCVQMFGMLVILTFSVNENTNKTIIYNYTHKYIYIYPLHTWCGGTRLCIRSSLLCEPVSLRVAFATSYDAVC